MVEALDLALGGLGQVEPLVVEEPDDHRLGVVRDQPDGDARPGSPSPDLVAGDRDGGHLEVVDVHAGRVAADHDGPLEHRAARLVSRETVTVAPRSRVEAQAMDRRTASSGLMSTLASPGPRRGRRGSATRGTPTRSRS